MTLGSGGLYSLIDNTPIVRLPPELEHILRDMNRKLDEIKRSLPSKRILLNSSHLRTDLEREVAECFSDHRERSTPIVASTLNINRVQVLRLIKRINKRVSRDVGIEPFLFDPTKRTWRLQLELSKR